MSSQRLFQCLELLGLALIIGGMLALGAFVAPNIFHSFPKAEAGAVMTTIFREYDMVLWGSLFAILLGEWMTFRHSGLIKQLFGYLRYGVFLGLWLSLAFSLVAIHPQIEAYQKAGILRGVGVEGQRFDQLHHQSETFYKLDLVLAILLLCLVARTDPRFKQD